MGSFEDFLRDEIQKADRADEAKRQKTENLRQEQERADTAASEVLTSSLKRAEEFSTKSIRDLVEKMASLLATKAHPETKEDCFVYWCEARHGKRIGIQAKVLRGGAKHAGKSTTDAEHHGWVELAVRVMRGGTDVTPPMSQSFKPDDLTEGIAKAWLEDSLKRLVPTALSDEQPR